MSKIYQNVCDGCGKLLHGTSGRVSIRNSYVEVKGQIILQSVDPQTKWRSYEYITPAPDTHLAFCEATFEECMKRYVDTQQMLHRNRRERYLRERAGNEANDRLIDR